MTKYRFRLVGVSPDIAEKEIEIDPNMTVAEVKELIRKEYGISAVLDLTLIWKKMDEVNEKIIKK